MNDTADIRTFPLAVLLGLLLVLTAGAGVRQAGAQAANGLKAEYFDNANLTNPKLSRTDPQVNFLWAKRSLASTVGPDTFSVRWTGFIEAPATGTYTFYTRTSDGAQLWVDGKPVVNRWIAQKKPREWSGTVPLQAGKRHQVKLEYYDGTGAATAQLLWSGPRVTKQVVPSQRLFPEAPPSPQCSDGRDNDGDTRTNHPGDPGCGAGADNSESPDPPPPPDGAQRWSDPATWGAEGLPAEGETVTIPHGKTVLLDRSTPPLGGLQVDGTLLFEDDHVALTSD